MVMRPPTLRAAFVTLHLLAMPVPGQSDPATLHVYANLVQVPVLVLSESRRPLPLIEPSRFRISLNGGRPFQLVHVRPEGEDPINLAVLIDQADTDPALLANLDDAVASLVPGSLQPQDTVTFFSLNCTMTRTFPVVRPDRVRLGSALGAALGANRGFPGHCAQPAHLWNALGFIVRQLADQPGRRVILALTSGRDSDRSLGRARLAEMATGASVSIFAVSTFDDPFGGREHLLTTVCEISGGMVFYPGVRDLAATLKEFVALLRGRYVVSFPLPRLREAGVVNMDVTVTKLHGFIRPGGAGVPLPDPALAADPNSFMPDPAKAPEVGNRRSLSPR